MTIEPNSGPGLALAPHEARAYEERGFFFRYEAFSRGEIENLRDGAERAASRARDTSRSGSAYTIDGNVYVESGATTIQLEHRPGTETLRVVQPFHPLDRRLDALIDDPRLVEPMRGLVGAEAIALFTDKLNFKRAGEGSRFRWHQDSPYWIDCPHVDQLPNVMLALDDQTEENGCLRVIPGSHRRGKLPGIQDGTTLSPLFTDPRHFNVEDQVPAVMPAGSLLFFSPHVVHGSEPNVSSLPRRAMVITYQPAGHAMLKLGAVRNVGPAA